MFHMQERQFFLHCLRNPSIIPLGVFLVWELKSCLLNTGCLLNRGGHYDRFYCT